MEKDNFPYFSFDSQGRLILATEDLIKDINSSCYFCDFSEIKPDLHHIIRICDGGKDLPGNKIPLCRNHHALIHRRIYVLGFSKGYYFLRHRKKGFIIPPSDRQRKYKRKLPFSSIEYAHNLEVEGDLNTKAMIKVKDFYKRARKNNKKRMQSVHSSKCAKLQETTKKY